MQSKLSASQLSSRSSLSKFGQDRVRGCKLKQTNRIFVKGNGGDRLMQNSLKNNYANCLYT